MYNYQEERKKLFSAENQRSLLKVRDHTKELLKTAGCFMLGKAIECVTGDSWTNAALVDRLVELGELREVAAGSGVPLQDRIFIVGKNQ